MFGLFKNDDSECPVNEDIRVWLEECFTWLTDTFGIDTIKSRKILTPRYNDFPVKYEGQYQSVLDTMRIVARQMEVDPGTIHVDVYKEGQREMDAGGVFGRRIFMQKAAGEKYTGGLYFGRQDDGKYHIALEENKLKDPVKIVATLSHEIAHIKLLGEQRIKSNNEDLTDLTTIVFGLGVFNANAAFQFRRDDSSWSWSTSGYLSQMEWAYALALFAHLRGEEYPDWIEFLSKDVKNDFIKSINFIGKNPDKIFKTKKNNAIQPDPLMK